MKANGRLDACYIRTGLTFAPYQPSPVRNYVEFKHWLSLCASEPPYHRYRNPFRCASLGVVAVGHRLRREVRAYLTDPRSFVDGKPVQSLERVIALEIASEADEETRSCRRYDSRLRRWIPTVTVELLMEWTGKSEAVISERLRRLNAHGLELRRVLKKDKNDDPVYAHKGRATEFYVPPLAVVRIAGAA